MWSGFGPFLPNMADSGASGVQSLGGHLLWVHHLCLVRTKCLEISMFMFISL